ncbi:type II toxin-antitoxin system RelE/ParE family toxin [uncultured Nisaea sp.]|uniref:type II toxin-antitoxin system RelE/ParE family toxin n=1 Tax=uncultured Nisaea sp. TaxID=538215 RepID=UPI0030EF11F2|tara:strand:+ start:2634 stop:2924 length:291 start_codon:yes stop_codon:yes gene_type:complete
MAGSDVRLAPKARTDLIAIWRFSARLWGVSRADRYVDELSAAFALLAQLPFAGSACDDIRTGYRRHPVQRHMIYYRRTKTGIEVMRILHARMVPQL